MVGTKIIVPNNCPISATYHRGGDPIGSYATIPSGKYIVQRYDGEDDEVFLVLAAADWDNRGRVTFESNKHKYKVRRRNLVVTIDLLQSCEVTS